MGERTLAKILLFKSKSIESGIEVILRKIDVKVLSEALRPKFVATIDGKDVEEKTDYGKREEHYFIAGTDEEVTERKREFEWVKIDPETGKKVPVSTTASDSINLVNELPYHVLTKNLLPEGYYLLTAWKGRKGDNPKYFRDRVMTLREEAERMAAEGLAGVGSYTWGK